MLLSVLEVSLEVGVNAGGNGSSVGAMFAAASCAPTTVFEHETHFRPDAHEPRAPVSDASDERAQLRALRRAQLVLVEVH